FLLSLGHGVLDATVITEDWTFWSWHGSDSVAPIQKGLSETMDCLVDGITMHIKSVTAEANRVAIESSGVSQLKKGGQYDNSEFFLFIFKDGKISQVHEYNDTKLVADTFGHLTCR